jgi:hypothetical protein
MLSESGNLIQNHLAHLADIFHNLEVEVEGGRAARLIGGVMPDLEIWVLKSFFDRNSGRWIKRKHMIKEVERVRVGVREEAGEWPFSHEWQVADVLLGSGRSDAGECLFIGSTEDMEDLVELINVISAFEEWSSSKQFCKNAAN